MKDIVVAKLENLITIMSDPPTVWANLTDLQRDCLIDLARKALECIKKDGD